MPGTRFRPKQEQAFVSAKSCTFLYLTLGTPPRCIKMRWARNMFQEANSLILEVWHSNLNPGYE
jgi:hypothetical protein